MYTMVDYESKVHNIYFSASFLPTDKLKLFGTVAYNKAEAAMAEIVMPDPTAQLTNPDYTSGHDLNESDFTFEEMHTYSDLAYKYLNFEFGGSYKLAETVTFTLDGGYADLTDDAPYVYGDETGSMLMVRSGIMVTF